MLCTRKSSFLGMTMLAMMGLLTGCKGSGERQAPYAAAAPMQEAPVAAGLPSGAALGQPEQAVSWAPPRRAPPPQRQAMAGAPRFAAVEPGAQFAAANHATGQQPPTNESAQGTCPVTGAKLGSMGEPVPVTVRGRVVYVCCAGCVNKLLANPDRYMHSESSGYAPTIEAFSHGRAASSAAAGRFESGSGRSAARGCGGGCGGCGGE